MHTGVYWQIIYWLSTPALAVVACVLLLRGLHRRFPIFFSYVVVACINDVARFVTYHQSFRAYAQTYWVSELINTVFALLATGELFLKRIFPQFQKIVFYRLLFTGAAAMIVELATMTALKSIKVDVLFEVLHGIDFVRVATLFFFVGLMLFMGRRWERY